MLQLSVVDYHEPYCRWANLPPDLRAIKDRWLGSSSEELTPQAATSDITVSADATTMAPAHGGRQDQHSFFQVV